MMATFLPWMIDRSASLLPVTVTVLLLLLPGTGSVWPAGSVTVPTGGTVTVTIVVMATSAATYTNTVTLTPLAGESSAQWGYPSNCSTAWAPGSDEAGFCPVISVPSVST